MNLSSQCKVASTCSHGNYKKLSDDKQPLERLTVHNIAITSRLYKLPPYNHQGFSYKTLLVVHEAPGVASFPHDPEKANVLKL